MKKNVALMGVLAAAVMATSVPAVAAETAATTTAVTEEKKDDAAATEEKKDEAAEATEEKKDEAAATTEEKKEETAEATEEKKDEAAVATEEKTEEAAPAQTTEAAPVVNNDGIKVTVGGTAVVFDQEPIIKEGRTLVPLRAIFEALGATIEWNAETKTVVAKDEKGVEITLTVGSKEMKVGDKVVTLDAPAQIVKDRTLVPVRAIAEAFGAEVAWDAETKTVAIQKAVAEVAEEATEAPAEATEEVKADATEEAKAETKDEAKEEAKTDATTETKTEETK
ncbi:MAG: copper amine oxidase N-terminal domain-containing protein [Epulopiscium sp.]|jgi:hypothetical protein|nr:copper amine oxidase N-terminal domain-containing protein [Candidatus Epulonipiscium sp.]